MKPTENSSLQQWLDWLSQLHAQEIDLGIERVKTVALKMSLVSLPAKVISVAGTNGKGSSAAMLNSIYLAQGYSVGLYTSPHLLSFNERIQVNGKMVDDAWIVNAFSAIEIARADIKLTYFEFATLASLWIFKQQAVDVVILEVGLGGRLDAVNLMDADASLITAIDVDHEAWLGSDRNKIALEKAGIMRPNRLSVCSDGDIPQTLIEYAQINNVALKCLGTDFNYLKNHQAWYFLESKTQREQQYALPLLEGEFQLQNAAGVVALVRAFEKELPVTAQSVSDGLQSVRHAGRFQSLSLGGQTWLLDVAHNPQSAKVLAENLQKRSWQSVALFSALDDKNIMPMLLSLMPFVSKWYIANLNVPRAMSLKKIHHALLEAGVESNNIVEYVHVFEVVDELRKLNVKQVLAWGSFFTVAQTMAALSDE